MIRESLVEQVHDMMLFSKVIHAYWDDGICAFRPSKISDDKTKIDFAFHWLPIRPDNLKRTARVPIDQHPYPRPKEGFIDTSGE